MAGSSVWPFSAVYVINLRRSTDRWESARAQLEAVGVHDAIRWEARDGSLLDDQSIRKLQSDGLLAENLNEFSERAFRGEISCALSHADALEDILSKRLRSALILEDDFEIPAPLPDWQRRVSIAFADLPVDWEIWFLFRCFDVRRKVMVLSERTVVPFSPLCATAYGVTQAGARKLFRAARPARKAIDRIYVEDVIQKKNANTFAASPPLIHPGAHASIINEFNEGKKWIENGINRPPEYWPDHYDEAKISPSGFQVRLLVGCALLTAVALLVWELFR